MHALQQNVPWFQIEPGVRRRVVARGLRLLAALERRRLPDFSAAAAALLERWERDGGAEEVGF